MSLRTVALATTTCGLLSVGVAAMDSPGRLWWVVLLGVGGALTVGVRHLRPLGALVGIAVLALTWPAVGEVAAVLTGVLLLGYLLAVDLLDSSDPPALARSVADHDQRQVAGLGSQDLLGWVRCVGPLWVVGALAALVVAAVSAWPGTPAAWLVATAPLAALLATALAAGRRSVAGRPDS